VYHFHPDLRIKSKFLFSGEPILILSTSSHIAMVIVEGDIVIYEANTGDSRTRALDHAFIPVSVAFTPGGILVGTSSGHLITITADDIRTEQVSSESVILHNIKGGAVVGGGCPWFRINAEGRILLSSTDCSDAAVTGPFLACLTPGGVAIFRTNGDVPGSFRVVRRFLGLVRAFTDNLKGRRSPTFELHHLKSAPARPRSACSTRLRSLSGHCECYCFSDVLPTTQICDYVNRERKLIGSVLFGC
jgi:hypothetical protein